MKNIDFFSKMDEYIKTQIEELKSHPLYNNLVSNIDSLEEPIPKIIYHCFNYLLISIPIIIAIIIIFNNKSMRNSITLNKNIIKNITKIEEYNRKYTQSKQKFLVRPSLSSNTKLKRKLDSTLSRLNIETTNVSISGFSSQKLIDNVNKVSAMIKFKNLSSKSFSNIIAGFISRNNISVKNLKISKNNIKGTIFGELKMEYLSE